MGNNGYLGKNFRFNTMYTMNNQFRTSPLVLRQRPATNITVNNFNSPQVGFGPGLFSQPMGPFMFPTLNSAFYNTGLNGFSGVMLGLSTGLSSIFNSTAFAPGGLFNRTKTDAAAPQDAKEKDTSEFDNLKKLLKGKIDIETLVQNKDGTYSCVTKDGKPLLNMTAQQLTNAAFAEEEQEGVEERHEQESEASEGADEAASQTRAEQEAAAAKQRAEADEEKLKDTGTEQLTNDDINNIRSKNIVLVRDVERYNDIGEKSDIVGSDETEFAEGTKELERPDKSKVNYPESVTINGHTYMLRNTPAPNGDAVYKSAVSTNDGGYKFDGEDEYRLRKDESGNLVLIQVSGDFGTGTADAHRVK